MSSPIARENALRANWRATRVDDGTVDEFGWLSDYSPAERAQTYLFFALTFMQQPEAMSADQLLLLGYGIGQDDEAKTIGARQLGEQEGLDDFPSFYEAITDPKTLGLGPTDPEESKARLDRLDKRYMEYLNDDDRRQAAKDYADEVVGNVNLIDELRDSPRQKRWESAYRRRLEDLQKAGDWRFNEGEPGGSQPEIGEDVASFGTVAYDIPTQGSTRLEADIVRWGMTPQGPTETQRRVDWTVDMGITIAGIVGTIVAGGTVAGTAARPPLLMAQIRNWLQSGRQMANISQRLANAGYIEPALTIQGMRMDAAGTIRSMYAAGTVYATARFGDAVAGQAFSAFNAATEEIDRGWTQAFGDDQASGLAGAVGADRESGFGVRNTPSPQNSPTGTTTPTTGTNQTQPSSGSAGATSSTPTNPADQVQAYLKQSPIAEDAGYAYDDDPYIGVGPRYQGGGNMYWDPQTSQYRERPTTKIVQDANGNWTEVPYLDWIATHPVGTPGGATLADVNAAGSAIYRQSDFEKILGNLTPTGLALVEDQMIRAGLINPDSTVQGAKYVPGSKGPHLAQGLETLLWISNNEHQVWQTQLGRMAKAGDEAKITENQRPGFVPRAYLAPDYASLASAARNEVQRRLGREINEWEMQMLTEGMKGDYREQYDQQIAADRSVWEAQGRASETFEEQTPTGSFTAVDPAARFSERFQDLYSDEIDERERWAKVQQSTSNLFGGLDSMSRMVG